MTVSLAEIEEHWSLEDVWLAQEWIAAYDEAERKAIPKIPKPKR